MASKRRKAAAAAAAAAATGDEKLRLKSPARRGSRRKAQNGESPKGKAEEICLYKTPKRSSKSCLPTFSSPANETDIQQEIFWDPHSPIAYKLGSGKKKQRAGRSTVEISEIVNRIAPQEEKPSCYEGSLLGMWIGDDAIPCTPGIAKVRSRTKVNNTRCLQLKNKEEELMKLAKQFDRNLTEAIQEQDAPCHNGTHHPSEATVSIKCQSDVQMENPRQLRGEYPQSDVVLPFGTVKEDAEMAERCESSSQKPIDLDVEVALNDLFNCSTQKCSGEFSQGSSSSGLHSSQNAVLVEERVLEETAGGSHGSMAAGTPPRHGSAPASDCRGLTTVGKAKLVFEQTIQSAVVPKTEPPSAVVPKTDAAVTSNIVSDDFEDWDADLLSDDSFVMQVTQNPELICTPQNAFPSTFQESCKTKARIINSERANSGAFLKSSNDVAALLTLQKQSHELRVTKAVAPESHPPLKNNTVTSFSRSGQNKISGYNPMPLKLENKSVMEGFTQLKSTSATGKKAASVSVRPPSLPKPQTGKSRSNVLSIYSEPSSVFPDSKPNRLPAGLPKKHASAFGAWDEPRLSDDVLDLFCKSDGLWDAGCEDDDLLYQVCDDVERNTLSQDVAKENVKATLVVVSTAKLEGDPGLPVPKQALANGPQSQRSRKTFSLNASLSTAAALPKTENSADPCAQHSCVPFKTENTNSIQGKLYRPGFTPDRSLASGSGSAPLSNTCLNANSSTQRQNVAWNAGKAQKVNSCHQASNEMSKYVFRKTNSSPALILDRNSVPGGSLGGAPLALGESKNGPNIPVHTALQADPKAAFKRHLSDSFASSETEQRSRKCSQEEIARKKQEALERRKYKMQALLKSTAPA